MEGKEEDCRGRVMEYVSLQQLCCASICTCMSISVATHLLTQRCTATYICCILIVLPILDGGQSIVGVMIPPHQKSIIDVFFFRFRILNQSIHTYINFIMFIVKVFGSSLIRS